MKKRIVALLLWLGGAVAFAQSIQGLNPSSVGTDGTKIQNTTLYQLPQVQPTLSQNGSATPTPVSPQPTQASNWVPLNSVQAAQFEFSASSFTGNYGVQVSNNPTPFPSETPIIFTPIQDHPTTTGGQGGQTKSWTYFLKNGWKYWRAFVTQDQFNSGLLGIQVRQYGQDANHPYAEGIPWQASDVLQPSTACVAATLTYDYKLPSTATGFELFNNVSAAAGACTLLQSVALKDPLTGQLQSIVGNSASISATGTANALIGPGIALPTPAATPPAGMKYFSVPIGQDIVVTNAFTGAGTLTCSTVAVPINR